MHSQVKRITLTNTGHLEIEIRKQPASLQNLTEDALGMHRLTIEPGGSTDILEAVNASLAELGAAPIADDATGWDLVRSLASALPAPKSDLVGVGTDSPRAASAMTSASQQLC